MSEQKAQELINKVCVWLSEGAQGSTVEPIYWDDDPDGYGPTYQEAITHATARKLARQLLKAARVKTSGGCPLCQA